MSAASNNSNNSENNNNTSEHSHPKYPDSSSSSSGNVQGCYSEPLPSLNSLSLHTPTLSGVSRASDDIPNLSLTENVSTTHLDNSSASYTGNHKVTTSASSAPQQQQETPKRSNSNHTRGEDSNAVDTTTKNITTSDTVAIPFLSLSENPIPSTGPVHSYQYFPAKINTPIFAPAPAAVPPPPILHHPYQEFISLRENYESVMRSLNNSNNNNYHQHQNLAAAEATCANSSNGQLNNSSSAALTTTGSGPYAVIGNTIEHNTSHQDNNACATVEPSPSLTGTTTTSLSACIPEEEMSPMGGLPTTASNNISNPFPRKLYEMLTNEDSEIVSWLPSGHAFIVKNSEIFIDKILPKYFRHTKLTSFQRQLNLYGFRRVTKGQEAGAYRHELFRRDDPELCLTMRRSRQNSSGNGTTKSPNFGPLSSPSIRGRRRSGSIESYGSTASSLQNTPDLTPIGTAALAIPPEGLTLLPPNVASSGSSATTLPRKSSFKNLSTFAMQPIAEGRDPASALQQPQVSTGLSVLIHQNSKIRLDNPERQARALAAAGMVADAVQRSYKMDPIVVTSSSTSVTHSIMETNKIISNNDSNHQQSNNSNHVSDNNQDYAPLNPTISQQQQSPNSGWTMPLSTEMIAHFDDIDMEMDFLNMFSPENEIQMFQYLPSNEHKSS